MQIGGNCRGRIRAPAVIARVVLCGLCVAFIVWAAHQFVSRPDLAEVSRISEVPFPPSARLIRSLMVGTPDRTLSAKVSVGKSEVGKFYSQFPRNDGSDPEKVIPVLEGNAPKLGWWEPGSLKEPLTFYVFDTRTCGAIGVDADGRSVVYVYHYTN